MRNGVQEITFGDDSDDGAVLSRQSEFLIGDGSRAVGVQRGDVHADQCAEIGRRHLLYRIADQSVSVYPMRSAKLGRVPASSGIEYIADDGEAKSGKVISVSRRALATLRRSSENILAEARIHHCMRFRSVRHRAASSALAGSVREGRNRRRRTDDHPSSSLRILKRRRGRPSAEQAQRPSRRSNRHRDFLSRVFDRVRRR